jgi:LacI family transcriptional regulator
MAKDVTIYDIAQKLKVSPATVSRALNDNPLVSKFTRKKVQNAAVKMGFRMNTFASNLRTQKTRTIGVIMHELRSNFMTSVLSGIEKVTNKAGYDLIIAHSAESYQKEVSNVHNLYQRRVDGLIASLAFDTPDLDHYLPYRKKEIPVIFYDRVDEQADFPKVIINNFQAGFEATKHLIDEGCTRIVLVTASLQRNVYAQRHNGYLTALSQAQIPYKKNYVMVKDLYEQSAIDAANAVLKMKPLPDGAFITHDFSAAVFMQALKREGIRIPEDIAIVGFNNDAICTLMEPQLSTINYSGHKIGEAAANHLVNHLEGIASLSGTDTVIIKSELVVRGSSLRKK